MNNHFIPPRVQRSLDALQPTALAAAQSQLPWARGIEAQLTVVADAFMLTADGRNASGASVGIWSNRRRERDDQRRPGSADDIDAIGLAAEGMDPLDLLLALEAIEEYEAAALAAGWAVPAAPASIGLEQALTVLNAASACRRGLRTVQARMRRVCQAELRGQGVLPGVPAADEVYTTRSIGDV